MDFYRIAIRKNPTGSMRLRVRVHLSRTYSSVRFQFGLMTKDPDVALARAWVLWCALCDVGVLSSTRALCSVDGGGDELVFDRKGRATGFCVSSREARTRHDAGPGSVRTSPFAPVLGEDGCYGLTILFSDKTGEMTKSFPLGLMTDDLDEANCRAIVLMRSFSRILARFDAGITCRAAGA